MNEVNDTLCTTSLKIGIMCLMCLIENTGLSILRCLRCSSPEPRAISAHSQNDDSHALTNFRQ